MDEDDTTLAPSPFMRGEFVQHQGQSYQVIKCTSNVLKYQARNSRTNAVRTITLPVVQSLRAEREEEDYFRIKELTEDEDYNDIATLIPWTGENNERKMIVRWDEDVDLIKDGLKKEDMEVFCTVVKIMGKKVMGDIKFLPKDPPIMKMPDLVMDVIFSKLSPEDRLSCRLVTSRWAFEILPINKFVACTSLMLHRQGMLNCSSTVSAEFTPYPDCADNRMLVLPSRIVHMQNLRPLITNSVLSTVESLYMDSKWKSQSASQNDLQTVFEECRKLEHFEFRNECDDDEGEILEAWAWAKKIVSANRAHVVSLQLIGPIRDVDLLNDLQLGNFTYLQSLNVVLSRAHSCLHNLESLPVSLTSLSLLLLNVALTNSQLVWIATHLPHLNRIALDVHHDHEDENMNAYGEDEVGENTVLEVLNTLPILDRLSLYLGPFLQEGSDRCEKSKDLVSRLNQSLGREWGIVLQVEPLSHDEVLKIMKVNVDDEDELDGDDDEHDED